LAHAATGPNSYLRLTPDELRGLMAEVKELVQKWAAPEGETVSAALTR